MINNIINELTGTFGADAIAGLSIAGLLLPEAFAYATIGNMPPQAGVVALFAGLICYGILGTSRFAIVSATSSSAAVLAAASVSFGNADLDHHMALAFGLVIMSGLLFLVAAISGMGKVTDFISKPVLRGFAFGLACVIVLKQVISMAEIHVSRGDFFHMIFELLRQVADWNLASIGVGLVALILLFLLDQFKKIPAALIVIALGILAAQLLDLTQYQIHLVGEVKLQLSYPDLPALSRTEWLRLGELGFALTMVLFSESYGSIRFFAIKHADETQPNRDLMALGVANLVSGVFHGMPVGAGYSGTSANESAGASSRLSGLVAAIVIFIAMLTIIPKIALTPEPILAAIVVHAVSHMLKPATLKPYFVWKRDRLVVVASVIGVLWLGVLDGLLAAIAMSIMMMLKRFSDATVSQLGRLGETHDFVDMANHKEARPIESVIIFRPDEPLFFANVDDILSQIKHDIAHSTRTIHAIVINLEESPDLDATSLEAIQNFVQFTRQNKQYLVFARVKNGAQVVLKMLLPDDQSMVMITDLSVDDAVTHINAIELGTANQHDS